MLALAAEPMPPTLEPELRHALAERIRYYNELGIYDFYRRGPLSEGTETVSSAEAVPVSLFSSLSPALQPELREEMSARKSAVVTNAIEDNIFEILTPKPEYG